MTSGGDLALQAWGSGMTAEGMTAELTWPFASVFPKPLFIGQPVIPGDQNPGIFEFGCLSFQIFGDVLGGSCQLCFYLSNSAKLGPWIFTPGTPQKYTGGLLPVLDTDLKEFLLWGPRAILTFSPGTTPGAVDFAALEISP